MLRIFQEKKKKNKKSASFYVEMPTSSQLAIDDVEEMKARAQRNKLFEYIKIPEVPICVSYKGEKDKKKILDVTGFLLQVPPIEYHAVTWWEIIGRKLFWNETDFRWWETLLCFP